MDENTEELKEKVEKLESKAFYWDIVAIAVGFLFVGFFVRVIWNFISSFI